MPTTIYSSSLITQRSRDKIIAQEVQNKNNRGLPIIIPQAGYGSYIIENKDNGSINDYRKNGSCINIDPACTCNTSISTSNISPIPPSTGGNATYFGLPEGGPNVNSISLANGSQIVIGTYSGSINLYDLNNVTPTAIRMTITSGSSNNCTYIAKYDSAGILIGATKICSSSGNAQGSSICSDGTYLYIIGSTTSGNTFFYRAEPSSDPYDIIGIVSNPNAPLSRQYTFIAKYNLELGSLEWTTSSTAISGNSIAVSGTNLAICGNIINTAIFNSYQGASAITITTGDVNSQAYVALYNTNGIVQWATYVIAATTSLFNSIVFDDSNNIYISGFNTGSIRFYDAGNTTSIFTMTASVGIDCFIAKYNISGAILWATKLISNRTERALSISYYDGNIYACGLYTQSMNIYNATGRSNPNIVTYNLVSSNISTHSFIISYDTEGNVQWVNKIDDGSAPPVTSVATFTSIIADNSGVYVTGAIQGINYIYDPAAITQSSQLSESGISSSGLQQLGYTLNTSSNTKATFANIEYYALRNTQDNIIMVDNPNDPSTAYNIYIRNNGGNIVDRFDNLIINISTQITSLSSIATTSLGSVPFNFTTNNTVRNILVAKYDLSGNLQWITYIGNPNSVSSSSFTQGSDIILNNSKVWVSGQIVGSVNFYEGNGQNPPTITTSAITFDFGISNTNQRGTLVKYDLDGKLISNI